MDSKELLEKAKQAYYNVQHKGYTKRSFIAGYLIGYAEQIRQYNVSEQSEQLDTVEKRNIFNEGYSLGLKTGKKQLKKGV